MVWLYLRRAISDLRELFTKATYIDSNPGLDRDVVNALQSALDGALDEFDLLSGASTAIPTSKPEPPPEPKPQPLLEPEAQPIKETPKPTPTRRTIAELFESSSRRTESAPASASSKPAPATPSAPTSTSAPEPASLKPAPNASSVTPSAPAPQPPPVSEEKGLDLPDGMDEKTVLSFEEAVRLGLIKLDDS
jgi:hypothetical protein